jgi:hypothetical protein
MFLATRPTIAPKGAVTINAGAVVARSLNDIKDGRLQRTAPHKGFSVLHLDLRGAFDTVQTGGVEGALSSRLRFARQSSI